MENLYTKDCIRTYSGIYMNVFEPTLDMICIEDIAHSLSMQCRFGGHLPRFYSVAQHSVNCCNYIPKFKLEALLHDAAEAYLLDLPSPIKRKIPEYKVMENNIMKLIAQKFGLEYPFPFIIHEADQAILKYEWDNIMISNSNAVHCWNPESAKKTFMDYFNMYKND